MIYKALWCNSFRGTGGQVETISQNVSEKISFKCSFNKCQCRSLEQVLAESSRWCCAVLKERLAKDVCLKETCSSGADDDRSDRVLLHVVM